MSISARTSTIRPSTIRTCIATMLVTAVAVVTMTAGQAGAAQYWSTGAVGTATIPQGICKYYPVWGRLDAAIDPPTIYARNNVAGSGNDSQWVRYRVFAVNSAGVTVASSTYSSFSLAYDNRAAAFSGATLFTGLPSGSRLDIRIEWWNSTSQIGALAFRVTSYQHYSGATGPYGNIANCAKW